jgi:hypothetical protein
MATEMKIYPASKSRHLDFWRALRGAGVDIRASWLDAPFNFDGSEPTPEAWSEHWTISEAAAADVVLLYARADENQMGALLETGAALAAGKQVFAVSPHQWSFRQHPRVTNFESLEEAVAAIMASTSGGS